ncbi:transmembrane protein 54b [Denticeps clupeoides]|uniref:transmembrane protein 54b n=1 Tax=Denticeps clupeoides TaxID=299321 RepID=UPI0010A346D5|nr:keratinocyte-associated protein 3-like [Denticeps clupeoides]
MVKQGPCCGSLEDPTALMKMGLCMIFVGHVSFLLGALVYGAILRHLNPNWQDYAAEYTISTVITLGAGLVAIVIGIIAIVQSKNTPHRALTWASLVLSAVAGFLATASVIGLSVSMARTIMHGGRSLLSHCQSPDTMDYSSVGNECPFDPTRIYSTTLILWVPLIGLGVVQLVFSGKFIAVCASFLGLPCCTAQKPGHHMNMHAVEVEDDAVPPEQHELLGQVVPAPSSPAKPSRGSQLSRTSLWI